MKCKLLEICDYVKSKINIANLTEDNYISTENMLPNKGGIVRASNLPSLNQTQSYSVGDVLISNIRPYFKKIWLADTFGGCSNDVLVLRAKNGVCKKFLYYALANDDFFNYAMSTSKGTKMPRGDKAAIMQYEINYFSCDIQEKIAGILESIDKKIYINSEINNNLAA